ncbi:uncharacterized protein L203_101073 [Cryptococcus depauperatus CBS 7841]|uniref:TOG domain-containing protein n=1 Tax=Cryptococcus depauperatus CBS 7841 TaxID=1295531 RepID=A0AAJ8LYI8_9TREE
MSTEHLLGDIGAVLEAFLGTEDEPRREAERHLQSLTLAQPGDVLLVLAQIGAQGVGGFQLDHRLLTLLLLNRIAFRPLSGLFLNAQHQNPTAPYDVIRETTRSRIETVICTGLKDEMDTKMRKGLGVCAANWAQECGARQRPLLPIPPVLLELTASSHPFHRFTPFQLLDLTPTLLVDSVKEPIPAGQLAQILLAGLNDPSVDVRVEAMKAMRSVLMESITGKERDEIGAGLVNHAFQTLHNLPSNLASHALIPLVDLASVHPNLFLGSLTIVMTSLLPLLSPPSKDTNLSAYHFSPYPPHNMELDQWEEIANPATEILISLFELKPIQLSRWEKGRAVKELVGLLLGRQAVTFDMDIQEWLDTEDLDEEDDNYPVFSEETLDRLSMAIGGELILPALSEHCQGLLQQEDWRYRFSAIMGISSTAEGCLDELQPRMRDVLTMLSPTAKDSNPRVRYTFIQCIGQLCADCEGIIQEQFAGDVIQVLLALLVDPIMRVRVHAAAAMTNFFQEADSRQFSNNNLDDVVTALLNLYQSEIVYAQEQVLATLGTIAVAVTESFGPFYRNVMDLSLHVLSTATVWDQHQRKVQGRAMECGSMIGMAVGKRMFGTDAVTLAQYMIIIQNNITDSDDPRSSYLMEAWSTICRTLKEDFEPFLVHVIPPLLRAASYRPPKSAPLSTALSTSDSIDVDYSSASTGAHTSEIDEKVSAFENLTIYAFQMRAKFYPFLAPCMQLSLEELDFPHSEQVREAAAFLIPGLLQVAKDSNAWGNNPANLTHVFQKLINTMVRSTDVGFTALLYKSFTDSLHVVSTPFPPNLTTQLLKCTLSVLQNLAQTRADREEQAPYMDESDREIYLEEQSEEEVCLKHIKKALEMLVKVGTSQAGEEIGALGDGIREQIQNAFEIIEEAKKRGMKSDGEARSR